MSTPPAPAPAAARPGAGPGHAPLPARTARTRPGPATRQTSLILGPVSTAPSCARGTLHEALTRWGLAHLSEPAQAIKTESGGVTPGPKAEIERFFTGLEMTSPGVVNISAWRPAPGGDLSTRTLFYGGVARKD
jgi:hypothetical protein